MNTLVSFTITGDGKHRLEELIATQIQALQTRPEIRDAFRAHPNLKAVSTEEILGKVSRGRSNRLIESGFLDSEPLEGDAIFRRGRELEVALPLGVLLSALDLLPPSAVTTPTEVLYEDTEYLALAKPADIPSAPLHSDEPDSMVHRALALVPTLPVLRGNPLEPGLIHRLDTGTSGVLLFAKTTEAFDRIQKLWNTGKVKKEYRALVANPGQLKLGRIELLLGHDLKSKRKMRAISDPRDKKMIRGEPQRGISDVKAIREVRERRVHEVQIQIETGIHHQIRATLAHFDAPILGDSVYGGASEERLWLHAYKLVLPGEKMNSLEIVAPLPPNWITG